MIPPRFVLKILPGLKSEFLPQNSAEVKTWGQPYLVSSLFFKKKVLNFHKWGETAQGLRPLVAMLEDQDHLLLCWRTTIWFPAAISGSFQSPITLFPGESDTPFWALLESVDK